MPAGITAISVHFPEAVRTNDWWRQRVPELIARIEGKRATQVWEQHDAGNAWQRAMAQYADDVFRGSVERRVMGPDDSAQGMACAAVQKLLDAAGLAPSDIDLVLVSSFFPDQYVVGDAIGLATRMGFTCPCYNVESACGVATADVVMASAMVESGRAQRVLIVVASTYSRSLDADNPMSWTSGDGAAAMLVSGTPEGYGLLGSASYATLESASAFGYHFDDTPAGPVLKATPNREAGAALELCSLKYLPLLASQAIQKSKLDTVDFVVLPTPTAWFAEFGRDLLGLAPHQTIDTYPKFANTGPVLTPQNLYFALAEGRVRAGETALLVSLGSMSSCGATVLRLGDITVAP